MISDSLFDPLGIVVLLAVIAMLGSSIAWLTGGRSAFDRLVGGLGVLRRVAAELSADHPIRKRLEAAPVVDLSFEEIARLLEGEAGRAEAARANAGSSAAGSEAAAHVLIRLRERIAWIERFAQFAVHLGILGTVFALVASDPTDLDSFRARLPTALGTTFWGLIGALGLSGVAGACETVLERANLYVRTALLAGLEQPRGREEPSA